MGVASRHGLTIMAFDAAAPSLAPLRAWLDAPELSELLSACLGDLLASVMQVSGVSFSVVASSQPMLLEFRQTLPAGVNVIPVDPGLGEAELDRFIFAEAAARGVQRTVILAGDTLALPAATVGTAVGVLESADIAVGATRTGDRYLIGAGSEAAVETVVSAGDDPNVLLHLAGERGLVARRMEPRTRLGGVETLDALQDISGQGPRVRAWLAGRRSV